MDIKPARGQALVITGTSQAATKAVAQAIASQYGSFAEIEAKYLHSDFRLGNALDSEPETLIIQGWPNYRDGMAAVKNLITSSEVVIHRQMREPKTIRSPKIIFYTGADGFDLCDGDRRYTVIRVSEAGECNG